MAERLTGRQRIVVARSVHPEYRQVLATYAKQIGVDVREIGFISSGQIDDAALSGKIFDGAAALIVQSPNFFGVIEPVAALAEIAHAHEALLDRLRSPKPCRSEL